MTLFALLATAAVIGVIFAAVHVFATVCFLGRMIRAAVARAEGRA